MASRGRKKGQPRGAGAKPEPAPSSGSETRAAAGPSDPLPEEAQPAPWAIAPGSMLAGLLARSGRRRGALLVALAAVSGAMWFLSAADFDIWPIAWVGIVPVLVAIEAAPTVRRAALYGWLSGTVANVGGFYWVTGMLIRFGHLPRPLALVGLVLLCAYQGVVFAFFAAAVRHIRQRTAAHFGAPLPMALLAPMAMVAFEMLVPFLFPWYLAITQAWVVPVIQIAELTGPVGVSALLMAAGGAIYDLLASTGRRRWLPTAGAAGVIAAALVFGFVRMGQIDQRRAAAPSIKVGVAQGNIPFDEKGINHPDFAADQLSRLQEVSADLERQGADLILWSESSYPYHLARRRIEDYSEGDGRRVRRRAR
jgi:apolipoprotein N-acyltransferase